MKITWILLTLAAAQASAWGQFRFRDVDAKSIELSEDGAPVFVYNHGVMLGGGAPAERARCCYLHPVYAPNGVVLTDDFPADHFHHRGLSWMWPVVTVDGKSYDLWTIKGIVAKSEKIERREAGQGTAVLAFQNGWYIGDRRVVQENVEIVTHPAREGKRELEFTLAFRAAAPGVSIRGTDEGGKGYGGFNIRFAPRTGTRLDTATQPDAPDSDLKPNQWAELSGDFGGKRAGARIAIDAANPGSPNGWCLRHYGFLGVDFPGLQAHALSTAQPLTLKYRVTLLAGASEPVKSWVLVYTRNGKGYVHANIASSVAAIRKMGAENGFGVDATDDPNFFTDAKLKQYKAIVFSNSNNEAFDNDKQRDAFKRFLNAGGGLVGIHSASGSERAWPYFAQVMGGSFVRHPKLQPFTVRVQDPNHPATKGMAATFQWEDECYFIGALNPNLHPLLVTDPAQLVDPERAKYPWTLVGNAMPLAWYMEVEGGREFYTALGHKKEDYGNPLLYNHILGGILWAMGGK